jgi:hypothetical protein
MPATTKYAPIITFPKLPKNSFVSEVGVTRKFTAVPISVCRVDVVGTVRAERMLRSPVNHSQSLTDRSAPRHWFIAQT